MPPRKRMRMSRAASPSAASHASTADTTTRPTDDEILKDPWTDEEEIGLFKGLIKWKPTGIHKHFRMLQLREYLLDNRYIHSRSEHTTIAGIWQKLATLYDLEALDQREDARQLSEISDGEEEDSEDEDDDEDDVYSLAANKIHKESFALPEEEYGDKMWAQRLAHDKEESPPVMPELNLSIAAPIEFTPTVEIAAESTSPAPKKRGRPPKSTRPSAAASTKRRSRRGAGSAEAESEVEDVEEGVEQEDEDEEEEDESAEGSAEESEGASTAKGRVRRGRVQPKARPKGRRR